jgi:hypothetical protein
MLRKQTITRRYFASIYLLSNPSFLILFAYRIYCQNKTYYFAKKDTKLTNFKPISVNIIIIQERKMKKYTYFLLFAGIIINYESHGLLDKIKSGASSIMSSETMKKITKSSTGQALGAIGSLGLSVAQTQAQQQVDQLFVNSITPFTNEAKTQTANLLATLDQAVKQIDQQLLNVTDPAMRADLENTRQQYINALSSLWELQSSISNVKDQSSAKQLLTNAPSLVQQINQNLASTAYATASTNLYTAVGTMDQYLASSLQQQASSLTSQNPYQQSVAVNPYAQQPTVSATQ